MSSISRLLITVLTLFSLLQHHGCASRGRPGGGPVDKTPPEIVFTFPQPDSLNIDQIAKIDIYFSERMDEASVANSIFTSPPLDYDIDWSGGEQLSLKLKIYIVTADTYGFVEEQTQDLPCELIIIPPGNQDKAKFRLIEQLSSKETVCIGNGKNDRLMLKEASLGIGIIGREGLALDSLMTADVICSSITDALDILLHPKRLIATLRL